MLQSSYQLDATKLKELTIRRALKQEYLASRLGVSRVTISRWLSGKSKRIRHSNLQALASELGCSQSELLNKAQSEPPPLSSTDTNELFELIRDPEAIGRLVAASKFELIEKVVAASLASDCSETEHYERLYLLAAAFHKQSKYRKTYQCLRDFASFPALDSEIKVKCMQFLGINWVMQGQRDKAAEVFTYILQSMRCQVSATTNYLIHANYGYTLYSLERFSEAIAQLELACSYLPSHPEASLDCYRLMTSLRNLSECYLQLRQVPAARSCLQRIAALNQSAQNAYVKLRLELSEIVLLWYEGEQQRAAAAFRDYHDRHHNQLHVFFYQYYIDFLIETRQTDSIAALLDEMDASPPQQITSDMKQHLRRRYATYC